MINIRNQVANKIELARGEDFTIKSFLSFQDVGFTSSLTSLLKNALCLSRDYLCLRPTIDPAKVFTARVNYCVKY